MLLHVGNPDDRVLKLAERLQLKITTDCDTVEGWRLIFLNGRIGLAHSDGRKIVLTNEDVKHRLKQARDLLLARACRASRGLRVLDGLAGWGTDGITLSYLGCKVTMVEMNPLVFALLYERVEHYRTNATCVRTDIKEMLLDGNQAFDVVYLDPMFSRHRTTAKPSLRMQVLEEIGQAVDAKPLVELALSTASERVVVKRRRSDPPLTTSPDYQVVGRTVRFDVYRC